MLILVVEDEPKVASFIRRGLEEESYTVDLACAEMMAHYGLPHCGTSGSGGCASTTVIIIII